MTPYALFHDIVIFHDICLLLYPFIHSSVSKASQPLEYSGIYPFSVQNRTVAVSETNKPPSAESPFLRLTLEPSFGMKYAYIDCEYIFEYEAQNDIKNIDGCINQAHNSGDSLQRKGLRLQHNPES